MKIPALLVSAALALAATGCGAAVADSGPSVSVVGFSVLKTANAPVIADFQKTAPGKDVSFTQSYGASGDQSRAVESGLKADEVHFSLEPDVTRLVKDGLVDSSWNQGPTKGIVTSSVVAFVVRQGNPDGIKTWDDLVKPGVQIVTPDPGSSGAARWNILAAWAHVTGAGGSDADASAFLTRLLGNTVAMPGSGKDAMTAFTGGTGDVLITYESDAIAAKAAGADIDYLVPDDTLLIENPGAVTKDASQAAKDFLAFQTSTAGQVDYAKAGFRPVVGNVTVPEVPGANDPANPFPTPAKLYTIADTFGGWDAASTKYFDDTAGLITKLIAASGKGASQ